MKRLLVLMAIASALYSSEIQKDYFFQVAAGAATMSVQQNDIKGSITLGSQPDKNAAQINVGIGYNYTSELFATLEAERQFYDDVTINNLLVSANKRIYKNFYIGGVVAKSYIKLTKSHINSNLTDSRGSEWGYGFHIGYEKAYSKDMTLFVQYRYLKAAHKTMLEPQTLPVKGELIRDSHSAFLVGVRF